MTDPKAGQVAEALLAALSGQECTLVRDSYAEQLVVGFGFGAAPLADWPLRKTIMAPWLLYSRYGSWRVTDGVEAVATSDGRLDSDILQRVRAVLLHQRVSFVQYSSTIEQLQLTFANGSHLNMGRDENSVSDEDYWNLETPGGLVVEAWTNRLIITPGDIASPRETASVSVLMHALLRDVANQLGLSLIEPPPWDGTPFDAVLTAPDGTFLIVQIKSTHGLPAIAIRAVAVHRDATQPSSTEISVESPTVDALVEHVRRILSAA